VTVLQVAALLVVAALGTVVVLTREPLKQAAVSGIFGVALAILIAALQAPDVALSQIGVGGIVLPVMILLALSKIREHEQ
jgi:uncharacterized MnhB-related membrane protein